VNSITTGPNENKILANARIFLTEASKKLKTKRFVESSLEVSKKLKIRKCEPSEHFRYIKLHLIYYRKKVPGVDTGEGKFLCKYSL
jgi:hypothetical protein